MSQLIRARPPARLHAFEHAATSLRLNATARGLAAKLVIARNTCMPFAAGHVAAGEGLPASLSQFLSRYEVFSFNIRHTFIASHVTAPYIHAVHYIDVAIVYSIFSRDCRQYAPANGHCFVGLLYHI